MKILNVVGARPNFMKIGPILSAIETDSRLEGKLVHTGQHYDEAMSKVFFEDLGMPKPDIYMGVGSGSHAAQTAGVMVEFEKVCAEEEPDLVLVVGDVNSTLACSLVAAKANIPIAHVEAGLRSFDMTMPEEINRIVTDRLSSLLFTTSRDANENLEREGIPADGIHFVGNVMIDTLLKHRRKAGRLPIEKPDRYALVTLHRPSNVDDPGTFARIASALERIARSMPVLFPMHPRTAARVRQFGIRLEGIRTMGPQGYLEFLNLQSTASVVLTDSGGLQEEATILGVPCLTVRENTERPVTIAEGTNTLVGTDPERIVEAFLHVERGNWSPKGPPEYWDGRAAERVLSVLQAWR